MSYSSPLSRVCLFALVTGTLMPSPAVAAPGVAYATATMPHGITAPNGFLWLGTHLWVADTVDGFCRLDLQPSGTFGLNPFTCQILSNGQAGQPAYDPLTRSVYVPDSSSKSLGVVRFTFDPVSETFGFSGAIIASNFGLGGNQPIAAALGPDGNLYVSFLKNGNIVRITNPSGFTQTIQSVGSSSDGHPVRRLAFVGSALYLAETGGVTRIVDATSSACTGGCKATPSGLPIAAPKALAVDGLSTLYVATDAIVYRLDPSGLVTYSASGVVNGLPVSYLNASALAVDPSGDLFIGDDPTGGIPIQNGRAFEVAAGSAPDTVVTAAQTVAGTPITSGAQFANNVTTPQSVAWIASHAWVSDSASGVCRIDLNADGITQSLNPATCDTLGGGTPGQIVFDSSFGVAYVADTSSHSLGVWRFAFDPVSQLLVNPVIIASGAGLGGNRPIGLALGPDGKLYVSFLKNGNIVRIVNPSSGTTQAVQSTGKTLSGLAAFSLAFVGSQLYLAEGSGVTTIVNATSTACTGGCAAGAAPLGVAITQPTALASNGVNLLYIAISPAVYRYSFAAGSTVLLATSGTAYDGTTAAFASIGGLALDASGNLLIGDDPTGGLLSSQGRLWIVPQVP